MTSPTWIELFPITEFALLDNFMLFVEKSPINDFILLKYKKDSLDVPSFVSASCSTVESYLESQDMLFRIMVEQLRRFHPRSVIHVLTNDFSFDFKGLEIHKKPFHCDHRAKFLLYGLLDHPALYLDCDIILMRPFVLNCMSMPINLFAVTRQFDLQTISRKTLPSPANTIYNAGIVWIGSPSREMAEAVENLHDEHFSDCDFIRSRRMWPTNDEYALSLYVRKIGVDVRLSSTINVHRNKLDNIQNAGRLQSIHYTGLHLKRAFFNDYKRLYPGAV